MKKKGVILVIVVVLVLLVVIVFKCSSIEKAKVSSGQSSLLLNTYYPVGRANNQVVAYTGFALMYNESAEQPYWVTYLLTADMVKKNVAKRSDKFMSDPNITTKSATPADYKKSGYDKGHLCPASDMNYSQLAMRECFYMSNMSPQEPGFNRGIWRELEEKIRQWALKNDSLIVITGPIFTQDMQTIGKNEVAVPIAFYKVVADISWPSFKEIAFIIPNKASNNAIKSFAVSVNSIEIVTGLDFFKHYKQLDTIGYKVNVAEWK